MPASRPRARLARRSADAREARHPCRAPPPISLAAARARRSRSIPIRSSSGCAGRSRRTCPASAPARCRSISSVTAIPADRLRIQLADAAPRELERRFFRRGLVLYPKHPLNADPSVAYFGEPATEAWQARFTSSRTLVVVSAPGSALCSVKLPTDHPHHDFVQPEKTKLREEAEDALRWTALFERVDAEIGPDPTLLLLREVIAVMVPGSESGFLVRDLTPVPGRPLLSPGAQPAVVGAPDREPARRRLRDVLGRLLRAGHRAGEGEAADALRAPVRHAQPPEPRDPAAPRSAPHRCDRAARPRRREPRRAARGRRRRAVERAARGSQARDPELLLGLRQRGRAAHPGRNARALVRATRSRV